MSDYIYEKIDKEKFEVHFTMTSSGDWLQVKVKIKETNETFTESDMFLKFYRNTKKRIMKTLKALLKKIKKKMANTNTIETSFYEAIEELEETGEINFRR
jgi:hypothetical protein